MAMQAAMELEVEDINAHLTRLDAERMLGKLRHYAAQPQLEGSSADQPQAAADEPVLRPPQDAPQ